MSSDGMKVLKYMGLDIWRTIRQVRLHVKDHHEVDLPDLREPLTDREIMAVYRTNEANRGVSEKIMDDAAEAQIIAIGAAKWVASGMQQVEMSHKFCASLLVSNVTRGVLENLRHPWAAFMIIVPDNLIYMWNDRKNEAVSICKILVMEIENKHGSWAYVAWDNDMELSIWRFGIHALNMIPSTEEENLHMNLGDVPMVDMDHRAASLISRLIITTCAALTMPETRKEPRNLKAHQAWAKLKNDPQKISPDSPALSFIIGNPVVLDFRERVREYSKTGKIGNKLEVGTVVVGHFKTQRYGKGNQQIKTIYRQEYYRGPEDAAMLLRSHVIKKDNDAKETGTTGPDQPQQGGAGAEDSRDPGDPVD